MYQLSPYYQLSFFMFLNWVPYLTFYSFLVNCVRLTFYRTIHFVYNIMEKFFLSFSFSFVTLSTSVS